MRFTFNFPDLGEGLEEGTILEWYASEGDTVKVGDTIVQMETDKVVADIPSPKNGTIVARYGNAGDVVHVGSPLVEIETERVGDEKGRVGNASDGAGTGKEVAANAGKMIRDNADPEESASVIGTMELSVDGAVLAASDERTAETGKSDKGEQKALATPAVRALAKEKEVDINEVKGSGTAGRVTKEDILNAASSPSGPAKDSGDLSQTEAEDATYQPLTQIRKTIAKNMLYSKHNAAHMSVFEEVEVSALKQIVEKYKQVYAGKDVKITYLPFIIKAVAQALKQHPQLNSRIDAENNRMIYRKRYHIGIAVDAPDGLMVPVIRDADRSSIVEIAVKVAELADKARKRELALDDMKDGSFTVTSFGSIGGIFATPVINYPQAGILGIGRILKTPIVKDDEIVVGNIMPLSLSVDHRIVDGGETTRFIKRIMHYLSDPLSLLMDQ